MTDFFEGLANQISDRFGLGESTNRSFDIVQNGHVKKYAKLGDFSKQFDQSAERRYLEEGYLRKDTFNVDPKQLEILMQEPEITVLIKKKMFSSIAENFRTDLMDIDEKLFYKTSRILFQNKCKQISAFEKLTKIERVSTAVGEFDTAMLPIVMNLFDELSATSFSSDSLFSPLNASLNTSKLNNTIQKIRKVYAFSPNRTTTSWINDENTLFGNQLGAGTGVIELTNVTSINTTTTVNGQKGGSCTINIADPYNLMFITESDIERALSDATNPMFNNKLFQLGKESTDDIIARNTKLLNDKRAARGASPISFTVIPELVLGDKVVAIVDRLGEKINFTYDAAGGLAAFGIGKGVQVSPDCRIGGELLGQDGLNTASDRKTPGSDIVRLVATSEISVFSDIITSIYTKIQLEENARTVIRQNNAQTNYARKKLRFYFLGKRIIQPMDVVHIYIGSKSLFDDKILSGLQQSFNAYGFLAKLDKVGFDLKNSWDTIFNPSGNIDIQMEKAAFVGAEFPNALWSTMRNQFVNERSGSHVFAGIVQNSKGSYSDGKYSVSINCADNLAYFDQGYVNFKPSADVWNGALYDPFTPFKTKFDTVSSNFKKEFPPLLDENEKLLGLNLVRYKLGPRAGKLAKSGNLLQDVNIDNALKKRRVLYAPDGLVYRWKEGIGVLVQFGDSFNRQDPSRTGSININRDPFAGQDVMNVLSLLITGEPYNYINYYKGARDSGNFVKDPQSGQDAAFSFYTSLKNDLGKRNLHWGNFIPFKTLSVTEENFQKVLDAQLTYINKNDEIDEKLKELIDVNRALTDNQKTKNPNEIPSFIPSLTERKRTLKKEIAEAQKKINEAFSGTNFKTAFNIVGEDVSYEKDEILNTGKVNDSVSNSNYRRALRRKINFLTRRMSWRVRVNEDQNLFIVDDYYDKDYDILAYEKSFTDGISAFKSDFTTVKSKINQTADLLNLEVFADTQGHVRVRPAQYNKMPSSVFYRMLQLKEEKGIQVFPQFLEDLFTNQIDGIVKKLEIIEDQIRFACAIMGKNDDSDVENFINSGGNSVLSEGKFKFISNKDGIIIDGASIIKNAHPENKTDIFSQGVIRGEVFSASQRVKILDALPDSLVASTNSKTQDRLNTLKVRLNMNTSQRIVEDDYLLKDENGIIKKSNSKPADTFKILKDISEKIAERQRLLKIGYSLLKNLKEAKSLDNSESARNSLLAPHIAKNSNIPEMYEAMVEDESFDDLGTNSGKRYIIKNSQIKSLDDSENPPEHTMVEVSGLLDPGGFAIGLPNELNSFEGGNNSLVTAAAVDYDMWRMYGMKTAPYKISAPYLHDPETQCAPYAAAILSRVRRNILQANVTIAGNEYMQPGEVIFLEDRGLLYYVDTVAHSFNYGGSFNTSLTLTYGHTPGEYICTPFDIVGKMMYSNRDKTDIINHHQDSVQNENSLGAVIYDSSDNPLLDPAKTLFVGPSGSSNEKIIMDIISSTAFTLKSNNAKGSNTKATIEIRIYYSGKNPLNPNLENAANAVLGIINGTIDAKTGNVLSGAIPTVSKDSKLVSVITVNTDEENEQRSPSKKALSAARNLAKNKSFISAGEKSGDKGDALLKALCTKVIDCWIKFEQVDPEASGVPSI